MQLATLLISATCALQKIDDGLTIYPFIPPEANQGWKVELFELNRSIPSHYHKIQRQIILVAEGELAVSIGNEQAKTVQSGEFVVIDPGNRHSLEPIGNVRFFDIAFPGFNFPKDVFNNELEETYTWTPSHNKALTELDPKYFGERLNLEEYGVYGIVNGDASEQKWSLALLEIQNSPKHFHQVEREIFIVTEGTLDVEIEGESKLLKVGESITIFPHQTHQLKSALDTPVRVLCFSFPAFDPKDMHVVD